MFAAVLFHVDLRVWCIILFECWTTAVASWPCAKPRQAMGFLNARPLVLRFPSSAAPSPRGMLVVYPLQNSASVSMLCVLGAVYGPLCCGLFSGGIVLLSLLWVLPGSSPMVPRRAAVFASTIRNFSSCDILLLFRSSVMDVGSTVQLQ